MWHLEVLWWPFWEWRTAQLIFDGRLWPSLILRRWLNLAVWWWNHVDGGSGISLQLQSDWVLYNHHMVANLQFFWDHTYVKVRPSYLMKDELCQVVVCARNVVWPSWELRCCVDSRHGCAWTGGPAMLIYWVTSCFTSCSVVQSFTISA